ncbi:MAG TPA: SpoIVB peptidase S55 domain-containing protein [Thermoanaerobaculales bacterium]|nr:SpoIVB peptidase S55 domain-containing protein [Thermoanaerobaculales bacterium]HPA80416.1 SpoIVB peptidase S55 domain-containing protein [Thermoanaerobaculales bacterium]HQL29578.1 SpoIVB peptidase S55 domain-containing protein [Thermoanaerobaculales bacterium]
MKGIRPLFVAVGLLVAAALPAVEPVDPSEVPPGSRGVCLTEMDGGELVEIPVTVLGQLGASAPERDIVLVRLDDPRFAETGIIAGMSGSPVYVDGRLLGALAYGWSFSREPIGGVTPFVRMLSLGPEAPAAAAGAAAARPTVAGLMEARRDGSLGQLLVDWLTPAAGASPQALPLALSMAGPGVLPAAGWIADMWQRMGWASGPGAAGAGGGATGPPVPGSMVAGVLVDGDVTLAAGGTVTEVRGDQLWAFGHAFLGGGQVEIPLSRAHVLAVLPSQLQSFKFLTVGDRLGSLRADRAHGVWGLIGRSAPTVPIEVAVDGRTYSFRALRHGTVLPALVGFLASSSLSARGRDFGDQTVALELSLSYQGGGAATLRDTFAGSDAGLQAAGLAAAAVGYLENSPFLPPPLEAVRVDLRSVEALESATLVSATPERWVVEPGESLPVRLRLRPYRGADYTRLAEVRIPAGAPAGRLDLIVADGGSWTMYDLTVRPPRAASFAHELAMLGRLVSSRQLVLALERREVGVVLPGGTLSVPPSVVLQLRSGLGANLETTEQEVVGRYELEMPTAVLGAERLPLTVRLEERDTR